MENKSATIRVFDTRENVEYKRNSFKAQDIKSAIVIHDNGKGNFLLSKHNRETHEECIGYDGSLDLTEMVTSMHNKGLYEISKRKAILLSELPVDSLRFKSLLKNVILKSPDLTKLEASKESKDAIREIMDRGCFLATDAIDSIIEEEKKAKEKQAKEKQAKKQEKESKIVEAVLNRFRGSGKE